MGWYSLLLLGFMYFVGVLLAENIDSNVYMYLCCSSCSLWFFSDAFWMEFCNSIYFFSVWLKTSQDFLLRKCQAVSAFYFTTPWPFSLALEVLTE